MPRSTPPPPPASAKIPWRTRCSAAVISSARCDFAATRYCTPAAPCSARTGSSTPYKFLLQNNFKTP
nr:MAG TPA_asm: hypothetical protein [Caudoviricetes sp.]